MVEDVEEGNANGNDFGVVALGLGEAEFVFPLEIEIGGGFGLQRIAAYGGGACVAKSRVVVVGAGGFGVGCARVYAGVNSEGEPVV